MQRDKLQGITFDQCGYWVPMLIGTHCIPEHDSEKEILEKILYFSLFIKPLTGPFTDFNCKNSNMLALHEQNIDFSQFFIILEIETFLTRCNYFTMSTGCIIIDQKRIIIKNTKYRLTRWEMSWFPRGYV